MNDAVPTRRFRRLPGWMRVMFVAGSLALSWMVYTWATSEPVDTPPHTLSTGPGVPPGDMMVSLAANLNAPLVAGNRVTLLENGDEIFPAMLDAIRNAERSVNLLTYVYWTGDIAETFANELAAAAKRGVKVRVLLDAFGARLIDPAWVKNMERAGVDVAWFRPLRWDTLDRFNSRTHRKALIVDGRIGFTGGVGIAQEWAGNAQDAEHWRDDHFRIEGPAVRYLQGSFADNWHEASGEVLVGDQVFPPLEAAGSARAVPISTTPGVHFTGIPLTYWLLARTARQELFIATPYYVPDPDLELGLIEAAQRGVRVVLLVPGPHQDSALVRYASRTYYRKLIEAGVELYEFQPTVMHTKLIIVDGAVALIGSPNFDARSIELNYEVAFAVQDTAFAQRVRASFAHDLTRSKRVTIADVERWNALQRFRDHMALLLREQL
ncbi:phospholipase D-like domain-containing protein [Cognatilysobacter bugurensis]|uniref:Cardiolipin synthase B n=1 Tax=Cognatilysobacter bugurensis TaxID=543356 RepID=A0A918W4N6_9GAMM|nr:phospholipase D-like domain-containing protein [Lysobacter bugurensis]GHA68503.1 cardiolipin synthase B [Lysobacter bugurensis]